MRAIVSFRASFSFLSNFFPSKIVFDGKMYPTVKHAFQAAKTELEEERNDIQRATTPTRAKRLGRKVALRSDWEEVKMDIMLNLLREKFSDPWFRKKLLKTGTIFLIEGNNWGDQFWGCIFENGEWIGENHLGRLLMQVRAEINKGEC